MRGHLILMASLACLAAPAAGGAGEKDKDKDKDKKPAVTGTIEFRAKAVLGRGTVVSIQLQDVSKADVRAEVVGQQFIKDVEEFPIKFAVGYDPKAIKPNHTYALSIRILVRGKLEYLNDTRIPVLTRGA